MCGLYVGSQLNRQHVPSVDHSELARETERLDRKCITANDNIDDVMITSPDVHVGLELGRLIQQSRAHRKMSQKDLAAVSHSFFSHFFSLEGPFRLRHF